MSCLAHYTLAWPRAGTLPPATEALTLYLFVGWLHTGQQHSVPLHELHEAVADGVAGSADSDGLHHPGVPQLAHTQVPVEQLQGTEPSVSTGGSCWEVIPALHFPAPSKARERGQGHMADEEGAKAGLALDLQFKPPQQQRPLHTVNWCFGAQRRDGLTPLGTPGGGFMEEVVFTLTLTGERAPGVGEESMCKSVET